jgi:hypothetical protein
MEKVTAMTISCYTYMTPGPYFRKSISPKLNLSRVKTKIGSYEKCISMLGLKVIF